MHDGYRAPNAMSSATPSWPTTPARNSFCITRAKLSAVLAAACCWMSGRAASFSATTSQNTRSAACHDVPYRSFRVAMICDSGSRLGSNCPPPVE
ncbi:MAG: hypothetical protein QOJ52_376 [Acidimicrobiaceae bacterium]|nr:hypothetical protein [Acidimicrobiaceae bacterium]